MPRLPSLSALRAFEAAGRLGSFTKAAAELFVTQAAVSHQVRALEEQLGYPLFQRTTRRLHLTPAGQRLLAAASAAFDGLTRAIDDLGRSEKLLTVTTTSSFGARWLAPRLGRFAAAHPEIDLMVRHTTAVLDLARDGIDVALRWGRGAWPRVEATLLAPAQLTPVAAPELAARLGAPPDIARATLLHDETPQEWREWLLVAGLDPALAERGVTIDDTNALLQAAVAGQGLVLATRTMVAGDLAAGRLVMPFETALEQGSGYWFVTLPGAGKQPKIAAFRRFVLEELARDAALGAPATAAAPSSA
jgi:LysR family glycine cleavage system transcriptional activator